MRIEQKNGRLILTRGAAQLWIDAWGRDGIRVRMTAEPEMDARDWALSETPEECTPSVVSREVDLTEPWYMGEEYAKYHRKGMEYSLTNGKLTVRVNPEGWLSFYNQRGELLTEEYWRNRDRLDRC